MNERKLAESFCRDVDMILQGSDAKPTSTVPVPEQYRRAVDLAKILAEVDFSSGSRIRQLLRRRLLDMLTRRRPLRAKKTARINPYYPELTEEELANVSAGLEKKQKKSCSFCNCQRNSCTIKDFCPDCGHHREVHPT